VNQVSQGKSQTARAKETATAKLRRRSAPVTVTAAPLARMSDMRLVVVDESSFVLDVMRDALEPMGFEVVCAHPVEVIPVSALVIAEARLAPLLGDVPLFPLEKRRGVAAIVARLERMLGISRLSHGATVPAMREQLHCVARRRLRHALDLLGADGCALAEELRTLAGEAYLVGERALAELAAAAQLHAQRSSWDEQELTDCAGALNVIAGTLEAARRVDCRR